MVITTYSLATIPTKQRNVVVEMLFKSTVIAPAIATVNIGTPYVVQHVTGCSDCCAIAVLLLLLCSRPIDRRRTKSSEDFNATMSVN